MTPLSVPVWGDSSILVLFFFYSFTNPRELSVIHIKLLTPERGMSPGHVPRVFDRVGGCRGS